MVHEKATDDPRRLALRSPRQKCLMIFRRCPSTDNLRKERRTPFVAKGNSGGCSGSRVRWEAALDGEHRSTKSRPGA